MRIEDDVYLCEHIPLYFQTFINFNCSKNSYLSDSGIDLKKNVRVQIQYYPNRPPELTPVDITNGMVTAVAWRLSGGAGPGRTYLVSLQHWPLFETLWSVLEMGGPHGPPKGHC